MEDVKQIRDRLQQSLLQRESATNKPEQSSRSECAKCSGNGHVVVDGLAKECECLLEKRVTARLPKRFQKASLLDFPQPVRDACISWFARRDGEGLLLTGAAGTGKTHLAAAMARTLTMISLEVIFKRCADLYAELRECYRTGASERSVLDSLFSTAYIVLDDVGAGSLSDHERRSTLDVLDKRSGAYLRTIVTTNWSLDEIAKRLDDRIASRLSCFTRLEFAGLDRRDRGDAICFVGAEHDPIASRRSYRTADSSK